jgi:ABC-type glycerol-3-phosphate transport system permease component
MKQTTRTRIFVYVGLIVFAVFSTFPLYWMVASSVRPYAELTQTPPRLFSTSFDVTAYATVLRHSPFVRMFLNTLTVAVITTIITVTFGAMAGHSLARMRFRGKALVSRGVLVAYIFPQILLVVPLFVAMVRMGLANTFPGLIITYLTFSFPFCMWMLTAYFQSVPRELEEAAQIDGASNFGVFWRIVLPLARPGLAASAIFTFIHSWNEFLYALVLLNSQNNQTLSIGLYRMVGGELMRWAELLASTSMMVLPILVAFLFLQEHFVAGLTAGAVKG